jgi:alcohol dehydrogenase (cytochrome c)
MTEYVDAGHAVDWASLSRMVGNAPAAVRNVDYDRLLQARSEPQNWLTYFGAYDGQRYSTLDQINTENVKRLTPVWAFQVGQTGLQAAGRRTRGNPARSSSTGSCTSRAGTAIASPWTP